MASVEQVINVHIKAILEGLPEVKSFAQAVKNLDKTKNLSSLEVTAGKLATQMGGLAITTAKWVGALTAIGSGAALTGMAALVKEGVEFNAVIESAKIGIATIASNVFDVKDAQGQLLGPVDAFNASLSAAEGIERKLQKAAIDTKFEFQDILGFFNSTLVAGAGLNATMDDLTNLTQDFALAAGAANIEVEKANTGIKQILTGNTTVRNDLAKVIFPGLSTKEINSQLKGWREQGTLIQEVEKRLVSFRLSQDTVSQSFEALASNVRDVVKVFLAFATADLFKNIKTILGEIISQIIVIGDHSIKFTPTFERLGHVLNIILGIIGDHLVQAVRSVFDAVTSWVNAFSASDEQITQIVENFAVVADQIGGIVSDLVSAVTQVSIFNSKTNELMAAVRFVAELIAFVRDRLSEVLGLAQFIVGVFTFGWAGVLTTVVHIIETFTGKLENVEGILGRILRISAQLMGTGIANFILGASGTNVGNASKGLNSLRPGIAGGVDFGASFSPKPTGGGKTDGKGDARRAARERLKDAQQLFDAIEKYQIANAKRDVDLNKQANDIVREAYARRYEQGLEDAQTYYDKKQQLDLDDLKREEDSLNKEKEFAKQSLNRSLGALEGKFQLSPGQLDEVIAKLEALNPDNLKTADSSTIKQADEYFKYLNQTADISKQLTEIDTKRKKVGIDTGNALADAARKQTLALTDLKSELADVFNDDGISDQNNVLKRISEEFPKILTETNKGVPGIQEAAEAIRNLGTADLSQVTDAISKAGVDFVGLSSEAKTFLQIVERLIFVAGQKQGTSAFSKIQSEFEFNNDSALRQFANGNTDFNTTLNSILSETKTTLAELQPIVDSLQKKIDDAVTGIGSATSEDIQNLEKLKRYLDDLHRNVPATTLIDANRKQADETFNNTNDDIQAKQAAGILNAKQARIQGETAIRNYIKALQDEEAALQATGDKSLETQDKIAGVHNQIQVLTNDLNQQSISLAQNINGLIGDAFNNFVSDIESGTESIGSAFKKLVAGILQGIANAILQALLLKYVLEPLGLTGGSSGGVGGFFSHIFGGKKAEGGIISGPGTGVSDSAGVFALSDGEGVIPARRVAQYGRGMIQSIISGSFLPSFSLSGRLAEGGILSGQGGSVGRGGTRIINAVDPNLVREFMSSADGEQIIINVIGKNPQLIQRLV